MNLVESRPYWNRCQFDEKNRKGHYESYFLRANHPTENKAFWIRYTIFSPKGRPIDNIGELWVMYFDADQNKVVAGKEELPLSDCSFSSMDQNVRIGDAKLVPGKLEGTASAGGDTISWALSFSGGQEPLLFLPPAYYNRSLPKAKALVGTPNTLFNGRLVVNGEVVEISDWQGSENHNWGSQHTNQYAWGQVCGFDDAPDAFLECATARIKIGPVLTPSLTSVVLRLDGEEYRLNSAIQNVRAKGSYCFEGEDLFAWEFSSKDKNIAIEGRISAPKEHFVGLNYYNPPGGSNSCLNSKVANCELKVQIKGQPQRVLTASSKAAFEILTASTNHGVPVVA